MCVFSVYLSNFKCLAKLFIIIILLLGNNNIKYVCSREMGWPLFWFQGSVLEHCCANRRTSLVVQNVMDSNCSQSYVALIISLAKNIFLNEIILCLSRRC